MEFEWRESQTYFGDLRNREVFYVEGDRRLIFMRVEDIRDPESGESILNAVDFSDGTLTYFPPGEKVDRVKVKMVLS